MCFSNVCAGGRGIIAEKRTEIVHRKISKFYFICVVFQCGKNSVSNNVKHRRGTSHGAPSFQKCISEGSFTNECPKRFQDTFYGIEQGGSTIRSHRNTTSLSISNFTPCRLLR